MMNNLPLKTLYSVALISSMSLIMATGCTGNDSLKYKVDTSLAETASVEVTAVDSEKELMHDEVAIEDMQAEIETVEETIIALDVVETSEQAVEPAMVESTPRPDNTIIHFSFDNSQVTDEHGDALWQYAQFLKENPNLVLEVSGHTDESGERVYNEYLSKKRAESVASILIEFGAPEDRIKIVGYASDLPLAGARNHKEHRRVELDFQDQQIVSN